MGISGTEVARGAADIIILDDNFATIVNAVLWGRNIFDSISKFIQFQLTVNIVAVISTLIGSAVIRHDVLSPIQMLWINLIMDSLASLALATERPTEALLDRKPYNKKDNIITSKMLKNILGQSIYQIFWMLFAVFYGDSFIPETYSSIDPDFKNVLLTYPNLTSYEIPGTSNKIPGE